MATKVKQWFGPYVRGLTIATVFLSFGGGSTSLRAQQARGNPAKEVGPFPPLPAPQQAQLDQILLKWQERSQGTKTLECSFVRWQYDHTAAPAHVVARKALGVIKYATPDKGVFKVDDMLFFVGMKDGAPTYDRIPNRFGEWWVCTGTELVEYDREEEVCKVRRLPPEMRGKQIFNSPLPFVFNLNAEQIKQRYWLNLKPSPKPDTFLIEAAPKYQEDRAQYQQVHVVLNTKFEPEDVLIYAPNFDRKRAPQWDHYELANSERNRPISRLQQSFMKNFIPTKPPASWKITQEEILPPRVANRPSENPANR